MMKIKIISYIVCLVMMAMPFFLSASEFDVDEANKVNMYFTRIGKKLRKDVFLRKVTFTEKELNSYLNVIYVKKHAPEVKYVKLKLHKKNKVSGIAKVKLTGKKYEKVPSFLKDFEVETSGKIECENYRMRYIFKTLRINGTSFAPEILDEAFSTAQSSLKVTKSLFDWFKLLPGLKKITLSEKKITVYY